MLIKKNNNVKRVFFFMKIYYQKKFYLFIKIKEEIINNTQVLKNK